MDLVELLRRPEGKILEFKRDLSTPEGVLKTIVAFANTAGGGPCCSAWRTRAGTCAACAIRSTSRSVWPT